MPRTSLAFIMLASTIPLAAPLTWSSPALKEVVFIQVTSAGSKPATFRLETHGVPLWLANAREPVRTGYRGLTPAVFRGFPQGQGIQFDADSGGTLRIEAWRAVGDTTRISAEGDAVVVQLTGRSSLEVFKTRLRAGS